MKQCKRSDWAKLSDFIVKDASSTRLVRIDTNASLGRVEGQDFSSLPVRNTSCGSAFKGNWSCASSKRYSEVDGFPISNSTDVVSVDPFGPFVGSAYLEAWSARFCAGV